MTGIVGAAATESKRKFSITPSLRNIPITPTKKIQLAEEPSFAKKASTTPNPVICLADAIMQSPAPAGGRVEDCCYYDGAAEEAKAGGNSTDMPPGGGDLVKGGHPHGICIGPGTACGFPGQQGVALFLCGMP